MVVFLFQEIYHLFVRNWGTNEPSFDDETFSITEANSKQEIFIFRWCRPVVLDSNSTAISQYILKVFAKVKRQSSTDWQKHLMRMRRKLPANSCMQLWATFCNYRNSKNDLNQSTLANLAIRTEPFIAKENVGYGYIVKVEVRQCPNIAPQGYLTIC